MKNIKKILLLIICCFLNVNFCYASVSVSVGYNDPNAGESGGSVPTDTDGDGLLNGGFTDGNYTCSYDYMVKYDNDIVIYGYNQKNKEIINNDKITPEESIKAGTSIGISIVENKSASWEYEFSVTKCECVGCYKVADYSCKTYGPSLNSTIETYKVGDQPGNCTIISGTEKDNPNRSFKCNSVYSGNVYDKCEKDAKSKSKDAADSYVNTPSYNSIKLLNPNDIKATSTDEQFTIRLSGCGANCNGGSCSCEYIYSPKSVCMNVITSMVTYGDSDSCDAGEIKIKNETADDDGETIEHFHYFIPLNVTSGSFPLILSENGTKQSKDWCEKAIDLNPNNYADFFVAAPANPDMDVSPLPPDDVETAKKNVPYGCYVRTEIRIPVSSGLYNVDDSNNIKGYNLYVRNVDENNPFPNPVTNQNSLWFDWYESNYDDDGVYKHNTVGPNIKKSFNNKSYLLENVDAKIVREKINRNNCDEFDDDCKKWSYLNESLLETGESVVIKNGVDGITFKRYDTSYYKIGCGPLNESYQEGCGA